MTGVSEPCAGVDGSKEAAVANLHEAIREDMVEEAADEFDGRTGRAVAPAGAKDDGVIVEVDEAVIRDGDAMRVVPEIAKDLLRSAEGTLGVHDPGVIVQALAPAAGGAIIGIVLELTCGEQRGESREKLAAEEFAEDMHGKQKRGGSRNPARAVKRESPARDETVDVRMKVELAGPGVEDGRDRELRRLGEPAGIVPERFERRRGALEEQIVEPRPVPAHEPLQLVREREDDVEIVRRHQAGHALLDPACLPEGLALRAMAVATGIVGGACRAARGTDVDMAAEGGGATTHHVAGDALRGRWGTVAVAKGREVLPEDRGNFVCDISRRRASTRAHGMDRAQPSAAPWGVPSRSTGLRTCPSWAVVRCR